MFYDRGSDNLPRQWIERMKSAIIRLAPQFNTQRMVRDYAEQFYKPAYDRHEELAAEDLRRAKDLAGWKEHLFHEFHRIKIESVSDDMDPNADAGPQVGRNIRIEAVLSLENLGTDDVKVELYFGRLDEDGQLTHGKIIAMDHVNDEGDNRHRYAVDMPCHRSGMTGYTVRVSPSHDVAEDTRVGALVQWAG
jgi:starch phosphorylase